MDVDELIKIVIQKNKLYSKKLIEFTDYCKRKMNQRGIEEQIVRDTLEMPENLFYAEIQHRPLRGIIEERYKLVYKISSKYSLIVVVFHNVLKVINVIKTSKEFKRLWRKKIL